MEFRTTTNLTSALNMARDEAMRTGYRAINPDHLMLGLLRHGNNAATTLLSRLGIDPAELKRKIDSMVFRESPVSYSALDSIKLSNSAKAVFGRAVYESISKGAGYIGCVHLLLAIASSNNTASSQLLGEKTEELREKAESYGLTHIICDQTSGRSQMIADIISDEIRKSQRRLNSDKEMLN